MKKRKADGFHAISLRFYFGLNLKGGDFMPVPKRKIKWCRRSPCGRRKFRNITSPYLEKIKYRKATRPLKLIFSSFGFNSPVLKEKFAKVISQDESLQVKTCLVIPYAGFDEEKTFEREKQGLVNFGFNPDKIVFVKSRFDIVHCFPDYIYVPGGDPFKLLNAVRENEILYDIAECVRDKRAVYIGVSAGADIATESIEYVMQLEDNNVIKDKRFGSLGLIAESMLCHYDHYSYSTLKACEEVSGKTVMTIKDDELLMFEDGNWSYVGEEE